MGIFTPRPSRLFTRAGGEAGLLCDRMSVNIELPSGRSLKQLAPSKKEDAILGPMSSIRDRLAQNKRELAVYRQRPLPRRGRAPR